MAVNEFRFTGYYCPNKYLCTKLRCCVDFRSRSLLPHGISRVEAGQCDLDSVRTLAVTVRKAHSFMLSPGLVDGYFHTVG